MTSHSLPLATNVTGTRSSSSERRSSIVPRVTESSRLRRRRRCWFRPAVSPESRRTRCRGRRCSRRAARRRAVPIARGPALASACADGASALIDPLGHGIHVTRGVGRFKRAPDGGAVGWKGDPDRVTGRTSPPARTMLMTPALRTRFPAHRDRASPPSVLLAIPSSCTHGFRRPVISSTAPSPSWSRVPVGRASRSSPCRDVLAHQPRRHVEAGGAQLVVELGVDQVHLPQVRLGRVTPHARAVLDRLADVRVTVDAEPCHQQDPVRVRLRHRVVRCG